MDQKVTFPDDTEPDCISATHAIEVDFNDHWAEAIGQALHYALWSVEIPALGPKKPGIILICRRQRKLRKPARYLAPKTQKEPRPA